MRKLFDQIKSSKRFTNIVKIVSGKLGGQLINILSIPILARIYGAEILGIWAFLNAICLFINSFSDLGLIQSIMIEKEDDHQAENLYEVISTISFIVSIISTLAICLFYFFTNTYEAGLNFIFLFIYLFLSMFFLKQTQICYSWLNKRGNYNVLMKNPMISNFSFAFTSIIFGLFGFIEYGYFIGWLIGKIITVLHMKRYMPQRFLTLEFKKFQVVIARHLDFIKYQLPSNILIQFKSQIPVFFITSFFGVEMLGFYTITFIIIKMPSSLLGSAFGRVFYQEASDIAAKGKSIGEYALKNIKEITRLALIPMIIFISLGGHFLSLFLETEWQMASEMFAIISFQAYYRLLSASSQGITVIMKKQYYRMLIVIAQISLSCIAFLIGSVFLNDILAALIITTVGEILINVLFFSKMFDVMETNPRKYLKRKYLNTVLLNFFLILCCSFIIRYLFSILITLK